MTSHKVLLVAFNKEVVGFLIFLLRPVWFCFWLLLCPLCFWCFGYILPLHIAVPFAWIGRISRRYYSKNNHWHWQIALVPIYAIAFGLTVLGVLTGIATVTKGAGLLRTVNCAFMSNWEVGKFWIHLRMVPSSLCYDNINKASHNHNITKFAYGFVLEHKTNSWDI